MSMRFTAAINKPGFNPLGTQTTTYTYYPYLYSWGRNNAGQLGLSNTTDYSSPKQVGSLTTWANLAGGGDQFIISTKTDGTLWSWGIGTSGVLGLGNTSTYSSPKQVGALTNWLNIAAGYSGQVLAVKSDGTAWSWGYNAQGQLGQGNTTNLSSPVQIGALTNWSLVSAGGNCSLGIKTDGTLWSWGEGAYGALGLGNTTSYSSPKQIGALTTWAQISMGAQRAGYAIKTDGTLWSWGRNLNGCLGLGNTTYYSSPKQIGALTTWARISAGNAYALAIKTDGTLWAWGSNGNGQLATGNITYYSSPKQVGALTTWSSVSAQGANSCGSIKTDGTLWMWGNNAFGQLGQTNTTYRSSPVQVGALTTWYKVLATRFSTVALLY
jgi:alpha-tubulin suppressor-like RCC1 family protein